MSVLGRLFGRSPTKHVVEKAIVMTAEEAGTKRVALWQELRAGPTPERAGEIAKEAIMLLDHYGREHALRGNLAEMIQLAEKQAGKERLVPPL
jgi:hypothetical protein